MRELRRIARRIARRELRAAHALSSMSTSEATVWKGSSMWSAQKASEGWRSYVFFVAAPAPPSPFSSIVSRLRRMPRTS